MSLTTESLHAGMDIQIVQTVVQASAKEAVYMLVS
jgi:hypothetical protein